MSKLSKLDYKAHLKAVELLKQDVLSFDDKCFVLDHWQESATHVNSAAGAFFTPRGLARDFAHEVTGQYVVELCAGIGSLAFAYWEHSGHEAKITCVEQNADYVAVGRKILPEAIWICADAFDYQLAGRDGEMLEWDLRGRGLLYDCAIANPPFGNVRTHKNQYGAFEYDLIAHARNIARDGVFIVPQMALPFRYSGHRLFEKVPNQKYEKFSQRTGITLEMNCGFDTSCYSDEWAGLKPPQLEIALGFEAVI